MIVAHIRDFGLEKPITVARCKEPDGDGKQVDPVCCQGRLEAFEALGETKIPSVIIEASHERDGAACAWRVQMKEEHVERIPIDQIHIANPRSRSQGKWQMIVANIREVGLKNPVLADLFYGGGQMDKRGSGLSDVLRDVKNNGGDVRFGPNSDNTAFEIEIFSRPEAVDESTGTASPLVATTSRYAANVLEVTKLPHQINHAGTSVRSLSQIWQAAGEEWIPPFLFSDGRFFSFYDLEDRRNPLSRLLDGGDIETLSLAEFSAVPDGSRRLVQLLNMSLEGHLYQNGLFVDKKRKRAYFPKEEDGPREITYQARLRKATRTVVKARISNRTEKVLYWEHQAFSYRFERFGDVWVLIIEPGYVFTFNGLKGLLASERVNRLSTQRASRDYNNAVFNDISFWLWVVARGELGLFSLAPEPRVSGLLPGETRSALRTFGQSDSNITLAAKFPTAALTDSSLIEEQDTDLSEAEVDEDLVNEIAELAETYRIEAEEEDHADSN